MFTQSFRNSYGVYFVFSETENPQGTGFYHITTRAHGSVLVREVVEYVYSDNTTTETELLREVSRVNPSVQALVCHAKHEHYLATHQSLFRAEPRPYAVQIACHLLDQVVGAIKWKVREQLRALGLIRSCDF